MGDHPVRRPHAPSAHRPAPLQELERLQHPEAAKLPQAVEKALDLADVRAVGKEDASRSQRRLGARRRLPGFGEIEEHPVHLALLEAEVGVAQLQSQVRGQLAKRLQDPALGGFQELLPGLVADHLARRAHRAQRCQGQGPGPRPGFEHAGAWVQVGGDEDRAKVLGVDRLGLAVAAGDLLREGGANRQQARPHLSGDDDAFRPSDEIVVGDEPRVERMAFAGLEPDAVPPPHLIDQQDYLPLGQDPAHPGL